MEKSNFKILLMDDEVEVSGQASNAYDELVKEGYQVDKCSKMSTVLESYYKDFYDLYILDIDMQKTDDIIDGTGMDVGEILRRLSSISKVLIFSALGTVDDWFESVNYNFNGYISKNKGVSTLLNKVEELLNNKAEKAKQEVARKANKVESKALLYYKKSDKLPAKQKLITLLKEKGIKEVEVVESLDVLIKASKESNYKLILLTAKMFTTRKSVKDKLKEIINSEPLPHIIVNLYGKEEAINSILYLVNLSPFRLLNLAWSNFIIRLEKAVEQALNSYGEEEILDFPDKSKLIRKEVSKEEKKEIKKREVELNMINIGDNKKI